MGQKLTYSDEFLTIWARVQPYTMTTRERGYALWCAVNNIVDNDIPGTIVECGVWKGGSAMLVALTLLQRGAIRDLVLFDTFTGMTSAGPWDVDIHGEHADTLMEGKQGPDVAELVRAAAPLDGVRAAMESTGYDMRCVRFIEGDVCETLKITQTLHIALLRLDTDFYESTLEELRHLYPRLSCGGILIIDDYGHWLGARQAVEEYFAASDHGFARPMLWAIDYTGRGAVKCEPSSEIEMPRYDYLPPGMNPPDFSHLFPHAKAGNPWQVDWPYLRSFVPHVWRYDTRHTGYVTGNASFEEAACLYTFASQFAGKRGLEIGTYFGWTAAHILAAGVRLDCVDPAMQDPQRKNDIIAVLDAVPGGNGYRLWDGYSPQCIDDVRHTSEEPWSFVFIDGNHDGEAPQNDATAVLPHLAQDAMVVFHDLTSPHVENGLAVFREAGFETRLINTMQVLGVAWRGSVQPPEHSQDPNVPKWLPAHLDKYQQSGPELQNSTMQESQTTSLHHQSEVTSSLDTGASARDEPVEPPRAAIWENLITLNSDMEPDFDLLAPAHTHLDSDSRKNDWRDLDYVEALKRDQLPLPAIKDREGYYDEDHFSYWASGLLDARYLIEAAELYGTGTSAYLDLGCASGRVLRHMAHECPNIEAIGCDINRLHVEWCNAHLPENCKIFQNNSIPTLPLEDNSIDVVSAFSVFTHVEALETAWLAEIRRVLKPGGIAWLTVHTEGTLKDMDENWPLWKPTMEHPDIAGMLDVNRAFKGNRMVLRWLSDRSYSSNVFYKSEYLVSRWGRILEHIELRRRFPTFQDVMLMRKPKR